MHIYAVCMWSTYIHDTVLIKKQPTYGFSTFKIKIVHTQMSEAARIDSEIKRNSRKSRALRCVRVYYSALRGTFLLFSATKDGPEGHSNTPL